MTEVLIVAAAFLFIVLKFMSLSSTHKGRKGEKDVRRRLRRLCRKGGYRLMNDIYIRSCGKESQIDHVLIGKAGIFVIETKNYQGTITGDENDEEWTQELDREYTFYNPVRQNRGHIRALKNLLDGICPDYCYHSIVVFPSSTCLCVGTDKAVELGEMNKRIKSFKYDNLSAEQMDCIESVIRNANIVSKKERKEHVRRIRKEFKKSCR